MTKTTSFPALDRLTVFTFLWACQALVHQEFYSQWLAAGDWAGLLLTVLAAITLLKPNVTGLLACMLVTSIVYNVRRWPFVVNHILMESLINLILLLALAWNTWADRRFATDIRRQRIFDRVAPVLRVMLIAMYTFAFVAKLNWDFLDPDYSCVVRMYETLVRRVPLLPNGRIIHEIAIWSTIVIEALIPLLLTFRRSQGWGITIGLPFHLMLGVIGHRTFSALAFSLYVLFLIQPFTRLLDEWRTAIHERGGTNMVRRSIAAVRVLVVVGVLWLMLAYLTGNPRIGIGPSGVYWIARGIWLLWWLGLAIAYSVVLVRQVCESSPDRAVGEAPQSNARPGLLWSLLLLVVLNGMSQYLGFKTETALTMYSNLRTEGRWNNHLFMPALRLANYQDDLVDILETDHPELQRYPERDQYITHFELRRLVSRTGHDFYVTYERAGQTFRFVRQDGEANDSELSRPHPWWLAKLLYFRPVPRGECVPCQH